MGWWSGFAERKLRTDQATGGVPTGQAEEREKQQFPSSEGGKRPKTKNQDGGAERRQKQWGWRDGWVSDWAREHQ